MNLIVLSNANIENFEIDLSNENLLNIEMDRIFDNQKEIKQKIVMKNILSKNSIQYEFINQINNKKQNELFTKLSLEDFAIINDTLFKKENGQFQLEGIINFLDINNSNLEITLITNEKIIIEFKSNNQSLALNSNRVLFKNYIGLENNDTIHKEYTSKEINEMYKSLINKLYKEVN
jgi:hypothetical protein